MKKGVNSVLKASLLAGAIAMTGSLAACPMDDGGDAGDGDGDTDAGCSSCSSCSADAGCSSCSSCSSDGGS